VTEIAGTVAVVTGGASGIGRALARALAGAGAGGVAVADLDGEGAEAVARELDVPAFGAGCDVADEAALGALVDRAERELGPVGLFCANAGVAGGPDLGEEEAWDVALDVNLRAHVRAARELVPRWLERGGGHFVATASAAGLVTQVGAAPYAVTKHAAVALAEWLAITYGDRGVRVSCLCPMGVDTPMMRSPGTEVVRASGAVLAPEEVAQATLDGVRADAFLILPHPEVLEFFRRKAGDYERWIAGMRRLQAAVAGT
jgi:NAD(P)-dependent dehydrogenase (short-subunit alcohol dehydrogenase family)